MKRRKYFYIKKIYISKAIINNIKDITSKSVQYYEMNRVRYKKMGINKEYLILDFNK